jgi:hypothetical protein
MHVEMRIFNPRLLIVLIICLISSNSFSQMLQSNRRWIANSKPYLKIGIAADGIYRLDYNKLIANGFDPTNINPNKLVLYTSGQKIPIFVKGKEDNRFDVNDFVEFAAVRNLTNEHRQTSQYNQPYKEYRGRYTDTTIYWLSWDEDQSSVINITDQNISLIPVSVLDYYNEVVHYERNVALDYSAADLVRKELPYWIENKTWIESLLNVGTKKYQFVASDVYPNRKGFIYAKIHDYASDVLINSHIAAIGINNSILYDTTKIDRYTHAVLNAEINSAQITEGNNTIKIQSLPTSSSLNVLAIDWVELEYPRKLKTRNDSLTFSFPFLKENNVYEIRVSNLNSEDISIWKYGMNGKKYSFSKIGNEVTFKDTINNKDKFFICDNNKIKAPKIYYTKYFSNISSKELSFDYVIITNKKFKNRVQEYGQFIADTYEKRVTVIDVDDIYDEFSYGFFNPEAIRSFLKYAYYNWQTPSIKYVCIIGGATYDYHGNKAIYQGAPRSYNYVPSFGSPVSDTWFVVFDSSKTIIPEISIGRIPVTTNQEFEWYFHKHKEYLRQPFNAWNKRVLFFSGGTGNDQSQIDVLKNVNEFIIQNYVSPKPYSGKYIHFFKTINPINNFGPYTSQQITNGIDSGGVFISYLGHSGTQTWDNSITDPLQLQNKVNRFPLITDFGCSTARFAEPDVISFSQTFVNTGQAIAYIANSSLGFTSTSYTFPQIFYKKLLADSVYTIGDAHRLAKQELISKYGSSGVYQLFVLTNTLIGDPIINLRLPPKPNLVITESDIKILDNNFSDSQDSLRIKINIYNYGLSINSTYKILIQDHYKNSLNYSKEFIKSIPDYSDSIFIKIPVKELSGEHRISVSLDTDDAVKEIYENDNTIDYQFIIPSGSVKYLVTSHLENYLRNPVRILSPTVGDDALSYILEIADNGKFNNTVQYQLKLDTIKTDFNIENRFQNKRIWLRTKNNISDSSSAAITFKLANKNSYSLFDSLSFSNQYVNKFVVRDYLYLDSIYVKFRLLSGGWNDGSTALILKDGQNHIPENTLRGHHVALFKGKKYEFSGYKRFDIYGGGVSVTNEYINFLDTLSLDYLVAFTISDEGTVGSTTLRNKIKEFGSKFIDNVSFRSSWVMLGRKGAKTGTVPEKYAKQYQGKVEVDTSIISDFRNGEFQTNVIGPVGKWKQLNLGFSGSINSFILTILGSKGVNYDTLFSIMERKTVYDISSIDPVKYPIIKINLKVLSDNIKDVVKVDSIIVDFDKPAEIVLSNRTSSVTKDTLNQGESISLNLAVHNVGETTAKNLKVALQLVRSDGYKIMESVISVDSIKSDNRKSYSLSYDSRNLSGSFYFLVNADPDRSLNEIYTDNNFLSIPFYVKGNQSIPLIQLRFDENDIFDGDYISSNPDIKINISNNSIIPLTDTTSVEIYLNNQRLYFKNNPVINYSFSNTNPKMIIDYKPIYEEGEYILKVTAKNPYNSQVESSTIQKKFLVSNKIQLLYVYNYPNPFSDKTYFTFKLTQIPDQLKIRIYTLAGRLVKEIIKNDSELSYDFNRIEWDGKDEDGSNVANGVYIYKVIMKKGSETIIATQKLAIVR